jgi:hypothetical protein
MFKPGTISAVAGVSTNGYAMSWNGATNTWMAYNTGAALSGALAAATAATNIGVFNFVAMGHI